MSRAFTNAARVVNGFPEELDVALENGSLAAARVSVPVTKLAKWKTTAQLIAIGFLLAGEAGDQVIPITTQTGLLLLWISAIFTIYTGWDYFRAGIHHLIKEDEG